ncbi:Dual specificity protein kinase TTK, partial [Armadillidium nasatum]
MLRNITKTSDKENIPLSSEKEKLEVKHVFSKPLPKPASFSLEIGNSDIIIVNNQNYLKMGELGKGGSSIVYEVLDMQSKQRKAIKIVTLDKEDEMTRISYKNEIKILQRLCHSPRIISLFDYEESPSVLKLVMEAGNVDLAGILKTVRENNKPIPAFSIKHYWQEMLLAVQVIHNEGIIHSDLKPANFLQVNGTIKLIDFGIASSIQKDMTSVFKDNQCGTFNFMSPESLNDISNGPILGNKQADKLVIKIGVKSDVWSLGCILYNLVYGKTPFQHILNPAKKLMAIANPKTRIDFPPLTDKDLLDVLQRCLQFDPYNRPSISDLLSHPYLDGRVSPQVSR